MMTLLTSMEALLDLARYRASLHLIVAAFSLAATPFSASSKPIVGKASPEFTMKIVDKTKIDLTALKGQVVIINFWATWCVPCRTELPTLDAFYRKLSPHGLKVFAITTEDSVPLFQMQKLFKILAISPARRITGGYGIMTGVPTNYIIDRRGMVRYAKTGALDLNALNTLVIPLLNESAN